MKKKLNAGIVLAAVMLFAAASPSFSVVDFEKEILPVFQEKCFRCHSDRIKEPEGGVRLDSAAWIEKGGDCGSIVEKMQPEKSVVYKRMTLPEDKRGIMPPTGKGDPATPEQLDLIKQWILEGARFGDWKEIPGHTAVKPPKPMNNTRLSIKNYGTPEGIQLNLEPELQHNTKMSTKLVKAKAAQIDKLIAAHQRANGVAAVPAATDRVFLRRAYLGIAGRIPTHDEAIAFLASNHPGKRSLLIDNLINTNGYVNHWFNFWADLFKVQTTRFPSSVFYGEWIKDALRNNRPYNEMAYELITATGMAYQNGATGWAASDENMAPDHMANNMQPFLGMQLQCAQCHDHPYDRWNQYEFQSLVSYFGGMRWNGISNKHFLKQIEKNKIRISVKQEKYFGNNMAYRYRQAVWEPAFNKWNLLPKDDQYADAKSKTGRPAAGHFRPLAGNHRQPARSIRALGDQSG